MSNPLPNNENNIIRGSLRGSLSVKGLSNHEKLLIEKGFNRNKNRIPLGFNVTNLKKIPETKRRRVRKSFLLSSRISSHLLDEYYSNHIETMSKEDQLQYVVKVLTKHKRKRTEEEILNLMKMTEKIKFFKKFYENKERHIHLECCRRMQYEYQEAGEIIFREGEIGDTFYIIISGHVQVCKNPTGQLNLKSLEESKEIINESKRVSKAFCQEGENTDLLYYYPKSPKKKKQASGLLKKRSIQLKILSDGDAFGELALIQKGIRTASCYAETNCHLAILNKADFNEILSLI